MDPQNQSEEKKTAKYDPGWNDPPTFSYNAQLTSGSKPRLALNKRVAFPLQNGVSNVPPINPNSQAPPLLPTFCPIPTNLPSRVAENETTECSKSACENENCDVDKVINLLDRILDDNQELGNKIVDIKRRINVMRTMWLDGKLVGNIQISMRALATALINKDHKTADEIHKSLMVDHVSSVSSWMVAIKQLILHCTAKNELLSIDED